MGRFSQNADRRRNIVEKNTVIENIVNEGERGQNKIACA